MFSACSYGVWVDGAFMRWSVFIAQLDREDQAAWEAHYSRSN